MTQRSGAPTRGFSRDEEALFARAEAALEDLGLTYQENARAQFQDICAHMADQRWLEASHIAHSIQGEAGSFHRPVMARAAVLLRDILLTPDPEDLRLAIEVLQDGLAFLINLDIESRSEKLNTLLQGLEAVADRSGIGTLP